MRTTIDMPDKLFCQVKATASLRGMSLKKFITHAVEHELQAKAETEKRRRVSLPLVASTKPGTNKLTSKTIGDIIEEEDLDLLS